MKDDDLDILFAAARAERPEPSEALMARVLADALANQPAPVRAAPAPVIAPAAPQRGPLAALADLFGGFGALAGMGAAAVAGVFIGFVQPDGLTALSDAVSYTVLGGTLESVALMPSVDPLFAEVTQ
jgi:hypothetical protein